MKRGYARVSTLDQDLGRQIQALQQAGCEKIYSDKVSGKKVKRPQLDALLDDLQAGDVVVIQKLDRLGRSLSHLIELVKTFDAKGVDFISLTDNFNTTTSQGRLIFNIMGSIAEFERDLISERTKNGLAYVKSQGRVLGRPDKTKDQAIVSGILEDYNMSMNVSDVLRRFNDKAVIKQDRISRNTVCKILKNHGLKEKNLPVNQSLT